MFSHSDLIQQLKSITPHLPCVLAVFQNKHCTCFTILFLDYDKESQVFNKYQYTIILAFPGKQGEKVGQGLLE